MMTFSSSDGQRLKAFYEGKTVLVTGHTGFKGAWLTHVLLALGARVVGVSLAPQTSDDLFARTGLEARVTHHELDIRDADRLIDLFQAVRPDAVFHLAAQALVRRSYDEPLSTMSTNAGGTANVLEAIRTTPSIRAAVIITTDKVYENREWNYGYRETDPLGGHDPYGGSKAAADIIAQAYCRSYFHPHDYGETHHTLIGIARAGNVIGGGDWSTDRLIPDIMRAVLRGNGMVSLRYPQAVRPWEHVLEPVSGYLLLGMRLGEGERIHSGIWNFGPDHTSWLSVGEVVERVCKRLGNGSVEVLATDKPEAGLLTLDTSKARLQLGWKARWDIERTLDETVRWYTTVEAAPAVAGYVTREQIASYFNTHD